MRKPIIPGEKQWFVGPGLLELGRRAEAGALKEKGGSICEGLLALLSCYMPAAVGRKQFYSSRLREGRKGTGRKNQTCHSRGGRLPSPGPNTEVLSFDARDNKPAALQDILIHS